MHGGFEIFRFNTGIAPQGIARSPDGSKLFVSNFLDRSVGVYDLSDLMINAQWNVQLVATIPTVANEKLSAQVLAGKQFFYDAGDDRLSRDNYLSCATCHNDGGGDGRVWDLTGMGEGLRNTISLNGTAAAMGPLHWSANFDEVHDFEGQIRQLSEGTGLMTDADFNTGTRSQPLGDPKAGISADLDALAAYVASLDEFDLSPYRNADGSLTAAGEAGREVFRSENCASCHSGTAFSDSSTNTLHDIGTLTPASGQRLGGPLTGLDTPTLRGLWDTAPYLHDGSAATLDDAVTAHNGVALAAADLTSLVAYLLQIDANEASAPLPVSDGEDTADASFSWTLTAPNTPPTITNPGDQSGETGTAVNLPITANDADGDPLSYSAGGLPSGLSIDPGTGVISGTPDTAGVSAVTVTVSDGEDTADASFSWTITFVDTEAPSIPGRPDTTVAGGTVQLTWTPSTDNVGVVGYIVYRSDKGNSSPLEIGQTSGTSFTDGTPQSGGQYFYSVVAFDAAGNVSEPSPSAKVRLR